MLQGINKLLTGDILKVLCDMGHGEELVIADANFPAETMAKRLSRSFQSDKSDRRIDAKSGNSARTSCSL